jgi:membrane protein DedA with SNARE-associated domain
MVALSSIHGHTALALLALATLLHEIGVPLPIAPVGLFLAARGIEGGGDFLVFEFTMIALTLVANLAWFTAGRRRGAAVLNVLRRFSLAADTHVTRAERHFVRWGPWTLVLGHFLPGVTLVAPPLAGALGMKTSRFVVLTSIGATLYSLPLLVGGFLLRNRIEVVLETLERIHTHLLGGLACLLAVYVAWRWAAKRRSANGDTPA